MSELKLVLITGRSLKQGTGLNLGKNSAEYRAAVSTLEMSGSDMQQLDVQDGDEIRVRSPFGQTDVRCRRGDLPIGMAFIAFRARLKRSGGHGDRRIRDAGLQAARRCRP